MMDEDELDAIFSQVDMSHNDSLLVVLTIGPSPLALPEQQQGLKDVNNVETADDDFFGVVSQALVEVEQLVESVSKESGVGDGSSSDGGTVGGTVGGTLRFGPMVTAAEVESASQLGVLPKARSATLRPCPVLSSWAMEWRERTSADRLETQQELLPDFQKCLSSMKFWLPKFVVKVRRADQKHRFTLLYLLWVAKSFEVFRSCRH